MTRDTLIASYAVIDGELPLLDFAIGYAAEHRNHEYVPLLLEYGRALINSPVSFNGRTAPFEGADRGSSPRAGAI